MKRSLWIVIAGVSMASLVGSRVLSQDPGGREKMDPMMAKMMRLATPGQHHAHLKAFEGSWNCKVKFFMSPDAPPEESVGTVDRKWILGGRFLQEVYKGNAMGAPFEGFGIMGYDNARKKYVSIWMDSMGTGFYTQEGTCDESGKRFTYSGENFDPMIGKKRWGKSTIEVINNNKQVFKMFQKDENGKVFMNFEMVVTRK